MSDAGAPGPGGEPASGPTVASTPPQAEADRCQILREQLGKVPQLPGAPDLARVRPHVLARARSVPVLFERTPQAADNAVAARLRAELVASEYPDHAILQVLRKTRGNWALRRAIFLFEGYLYAELPLLALRVSQIIRLDHLFDDERLVIQRGERWIHVQRREGKYFRAPDGASGDALSSELASLLLFDRVAASKEEMGEPLHIDVEPLARRVGFSSLEVLAITAQRWAFRARSYDAKSLLIVERSAEPQSAAVTVVCESSRQPEQLAEERQKLLSDQRLVDPILAAARAMIERRLPFDEPRTEEGQQDGHLRMHFRAAYKSYQYTYEFNGDNYYVFDRLGRVRLPQVCIDFISDAFDWGTGGSWPDRGHGRARIKGALHFASLDIKNARSVEHLAAFASKTPEWFEMTWVEKEERVKFRDSTRFFAELSKNAHHYRRGDVVFIYGLRDDGKHHYHSFFIDQKDPVTGMPTVVAANAGPPQARSWEGEMQNAPRRAIVAKMRVRREVLEQAYRQAKLHPGQPLLPPTTREPSKDGGEGDVDRSGG